jgi:pimeloyl-ACP methyl ester carboxylesterase
LWSSLSLGLVLAGALIIPTSSAAQTPALKTALAAASQAQGSPAAPTGITSHYTMAPGFRMHYLRAGQGEPLLLLHGWPQHSLMWQKIMPALAQQYTVIAPDLRGAGNTAVTADGYDKRTMANDARTLMRSLGFENVNIAAHDHGAGVGYAYAAQYREEVRKLAVLDFALPGFGYEGAMATPPEADRDWNWQVAFFTIPDVAEPLLRGNERELLRWFFTHTAHVEPAVRGREFEAYVRAISRSGYLGAGMRYYDEAWTDLANNREFAAAGKLTIPVLALGGAAGGGEFVQMSFSAVASDVTGVVVPEAGHWVVDEQPQAVTQHLLDFLR